MEHSSVKCFGEPTLSQCRMGRGNPVFEILLLGKRRNACILNSSKQTAEEMTLGLVSLEWEYLNAGVSYIASPSFLSLH